MTACEVHGFIADLRMIPIPGAKLVFYGDPQGWRRSGEALIPTNIVKVETGADGSFMVRLVPGRYRVRYGPTSVEAFVTVPKAEIAYLAQLIDLPPPPTLDAAQQAVLDAQSAATDATAARDTANAAASVAQDMAEAAATDRAAVAADRAAVAADRSAVTADRVTVANDRTAIAADRAGVAADRAAVDAALPALQAATATAQAAAVSAQGASTAANAAAAAAAAAAAGKVAGVGVTAIRWLTDAEYAALSPPDPATLYVHPGGLHAGAVPIAGGTVTPPAEPDLGWQITTGVGQLTVLSHPATTPPTVVSVGVGTITLS